MHPMSESEIARMAVAMAAGSSNTPGFSSSLMGGRVPAHPAVRGKYDLYSIICHPIQSMLHDLNHHTRSNKINQLKNWNMRDAAFEK